MRYPKTCMLKDCKDAVIRLIREDDRELLENFYKALSEEQRWYMENDFLDPAVMDRWFRKVAREELTSVIALCENRIAGHATLHVPEFGSTRHVGRFRIIVHPDFRKQRLGTWVLLDIIQLAVDMELEMLRTDVVVGIEDTAIDAVARFDFFKYAVIEKYVKDPEGNFHDLAVMIKRLHKNWSDF